MTSRLYWIAIGGLSFWLPFVVVSVALHEDVDWWTLNAVALAGVTLLCAASWLVTRKPPGWGLSKRRDVEGSNA